MLQRHFCPQSVSIFPVNLASAMSGANKGTHPPLGDGRPTNMLQQHSYLVICIYLSGHIFSAMSGDNEGNHPPLFAMAGRLKCRCCKRIIPVQSVFIFTPYLSAPTSERYRGKSLISPSDCRPSPIPNSNRYLCAPNLCHPSYPPPDHLSAPMSGVREETYPHIRDFRMTSMPQQNSSCITFIYRVFQNECLFSYALTCS